MNKTFLQMQEIINLSEVNQWLLSFYPTVKMSYPYDDSVKKCQELLALKCHTKS